MVEQPFQIPGLGQARSDDQLPTDSFAPDLLVAAASASDATAQEALLAVIGGTGMYPQSKIERRCMAQMLTERIRYFHHDRDRRRDCDSECDSECARGRSRQPRRCKAR